jgi:hypothetical protein
LNSEGFVLMFALFSPVLLSDSAVPFDKEYIAQQIIAGGGIILEHFDISKVGFVAKCPLILC